MSTNLFWRPVLKAPNDVCLSKDLKFKLAMRLFDQDGSLASDPITIGQAETGYLYGLVDAGVEDADKLLDAVKKHGEVEIEII